MTTHKVILALALAALTLTAACANGDANGDAVASARTPGATETPASDAEATPDAKRFAACLRERGLEVADPRPGEQVELGTKDDRTRAALRACAQFAPPSEQQGAPIDPAAARAYASCVRDKGFPDFPDPDAQGPRIPKDLIGDPRFESADRECARLLNDGKGAKK